MVSWTAQERSYHTISSKLSRGIDQKKPCASLFTGTLYSVDGMAFSSAPSMCVQRFTESLVATFACSSNGAGHEGCTATAYTGVAVPGLTSQAPLALTSALFGAMSSTLSV